MKFEMISFMILAGALSGCGMSPGEMGMTGDWDKATVSDREIRLNDDLVSEIAKSPQAHQFQAHAQSAGIIVEREQIENALKTLNSRFYRETLPLDFLMWVFPVAGSAYYAATANDTSRISFNIKDFKNDLTDKEWLARACAGMGRNQRLGVTMVRMNNVVHYDMAHPNVANLETGFSVSVRTLAPKESAIFPILEMECSQYTVQKSYDPVGDEASFVEKVGNDFRR